MKCEFNYCVYNFNCKCTIDDIEINDCGMCDSMLLTSIAEDILNEFKYDQLESYDE